MNLTWRDVDVLQHCISESGFILPRRVTQFSRKQQGDLIKAVKTAQRMALDLKGKMPVEFMPTNAQGTTVRLPRKPSDPLPLALAQLDYGKSEIDRALAGLQAQGLTVDAPLADRIRASLTLLSGKK